MMFRIAALGLLFAGPVLADEAALPLKAGPGMDTVQAQCGVCHSLDYIRTNGGFLSPDGWKAEIAKMRGPFGAPADDAAAEEILRYLIANYGAPPKT